MDLSVVFSFRNEEDTIPELITRMRDSLAPLNLKYELIFVNDDSFDQSLPMLKRYAESDPRIKIINMSRNFGNSPCAMAGFRYASGDGVLIMDADLQDPPELIPELWTKLKEGADVVYTTRRRRAGEGRVKLGLTFLAYRIVRYFADIRIPVDSGDFKLMSKRVIRELIKLNEYDPFLRGLVTWVGFKQVPVYYERQARFKGESHFSVFSRNPFRALLAGITSFSTFPLEAALILGFGVAGLAFVYLISVITMFFLGWNIPGWTTIVGIFLIGFGTQLIVTGMNGIYLGRIYQNVQNRPLYIVESTIGFESEKKAHVLET